MKISGIFETVEESLYTVRYSHETLHEFRRLFDAWNDAAYLATFFEQHKAD
ncbi:MAG: hypothetical protein AAFP19_26360 [Bacteroidota bacterium]